MVSLGEFRKNGNLAAAWKTYCSQVQFFASTIYVLFKTPPMYLIRPMYDQFCSISFQPKPYQILRTYFFLYKIQPKKIK